MKKDANPLYINIYNDILKKIKEGSLETNTLLPSESDLQKIYRVSRITIRRAVSELEKDGFVLKQPGIGTLVLSDKTLISLKGINSFSSENSNESSELIDFSIIVPPINVKIALDLKGDQRVYLVERVRKSDDIIIGFHRAFIPINLLRLKKSDFENEHCSLYKIFENNKINLTEGYETIEAIASDKNLSKILNIKINTPLIYKERVSKQNDLYVEFFEMYYIGNAYKYRVELKN